jgi:phosphoribosylformylglycinamidine synthase
VTSASNPNGASRNIAGICNAGRNVFAMMPHPERACSAVLENTDGRLILQSLLIEKNRSLTSNKAVPSNFKKSLV